MMSIEKKKTAVTRSIIFCIFMSALYFSRVSASTVTTKELLMHPEDYNGRIVTVRGEVVGEVLKDKEGFWFNLLDDGVNIGAYCSKEALVEKITRTGSYAARGDSIAATGVFYSQCFLHSERDLHAQDIEVIAEGYSLHEPVSPLKKKALYVLTIICLTFALLCLIRLHYERGIKTTQGPGA